MIDLHIHLLPGIDDGARELEEAVAMCRAAAEDGCEVLVATPHQRHPSWLNTDRSRLNHLLDRVRGALDGDGPTLHAGAEIRVDSELLDDLDRHPASGLQPLAGSSYLLLELDRHGFGPTPEEMLHEVIVAGWRPILAHPELIRPLTIDLPRVEGLVAAGAMLQITAMSLTGEFGEEPRRVATAFLDAGLVHFVASDAHGVTRRPPGLSSARRTIAEGWGEAAAARLFEENPRAVLEDRPLG